VGEAAYLNSRNAPTLSGIARTGETAIASTTATDLVAGDQVEVQGCSIDVELIGGVFKVPPSATVAGSASVDFSGNVASGNTARSLVTTVSQSGTYEGVYHKALRLPEGLVMVLGGESQAADVSTTIANPVVFDITAVSVSPAGREEDYRWRKLSTRTLTVGRRDFGASVLGDGRVVATGGHNSTNLAVVAPGNKWDVLTYNNAPGDNLINSGTMPAALGAHGQCVTAGGQVVISGGWTAAWTDRLVATYKFNPYSFAWTTMANMSIARAQHDLVLLVTGKVLAVGGRQSGVVPTSYDGTILNSCELYNVGGNTWTRTGNMDSSRFAFGIVTLPDHRVLVVGGIGYNPSRGTTAAILKTTEIFDPYTGFWTPGPTMSVARDFPVVAYVEASNSIVVAGGSGVTSIEILDLDTMTFRKSLATVGTAHRRSAGAIAGVDTLVVAGGSLGQSPESTEKVNFVMVPGEETLSAGGLNGMFTVDSVDGATFTYRTPEHQGYTSPTMGDPPETSEPVPGSFIVDRSQGFEMTSIGGALVSPIQQHQHYSSIEISQPVLIPPATPFPDEVGYLVFNFGFANQTGPIKYLGRISTTQLELDAGFTFPQGVDAGATVTLVQKGSPQTDASANPKAFNLTASAAGRSAAQSTLESILAAGIDHTITITYPGSRGLGGEESPTHGSPKLSDIVGMFAGNDIDLEIEKARQDG
jgi:hypothetical protein